MPMDFPDMKSPAVEWCGANCPDDITLDCGLPMGHDGDHLSTATGVEWSGPRRILRAPSTPIPEPELRLESLADLQVIVNDFNEKYGPPPSQEAYDSWNTRTPSPEPSEDEPLMCERCGGSGYIPEGCEASKYCNDCAQEIVNDMEHVALDRLEEAVKGLRKNAYGSTWADGYNIGLQVALDLIKKEREGK